MSEQPTSNQCLADALDEAAERVAKYCFRGAGALMSIPARPDYDVDLLLSEAARRLRAADETPACPHVRCNICNPTAVGKYNK